MRRWIWFFLFASALLITARQASGQITADEAIDLLEQMPAVRLDSLLPKSPFLDWLKSIVGPEAKLDWEINDCGEQTGVPLIDQNRDMPVCVEITASLPDRRTVGIMIGIGTQRKGIAEAPGVSNIYLEAGDKIYYFKRLRELPKALQETRTH